MTRCTKSVQNGPIAKADVSAALAVGLTRAIRNVGGKGTLADSMGANTKTIDRALTGDTVPELHTALNALNADATALDEVLKLYGVRAVPLHAEAANDMELVAGLSDTVTEFVRRLSDGRRCHIDTAILAELFRKLVPQMQAIVCEHDARVAA